MSPRASVPGRPDTYRPVLLSTGVFDPPRAARRTKWRLAQGTRELTYTTLVERIQSGRYSSNP